MAAHREDAGGGSGDGGKGGGLTVYDYGRAASWEAVC